MAYLEFEIPARSWSSNEREILMAKMSQIGFEGFVDGDDIIQAYIEEELYSGSALNQLIDELSDLGIKIQYRYHKTEDQNWNEEWEKKFSPVFIDDKVLIRAPFHGSEKDFPCTLIIEPKMSFGTFLLKILAALAGGIVGTLILLLIFVVASSVLTPLTETTDI